MVGTRKLILALAKSDKPLNRYALNKETDLDPASILRYCRDFRRLKILDLHKIEKTNQICTQYELTYEGRMVALVLDLDSEHGSGLDRKKLLKDLIENMLAASAFHKFSQRVYSVLIEKGREDVAMDMLRRSVETTFEKGIADPWLGGMFAATEIDFQDGFFLRVVQEVFSTMNQDDLIAVKLNMKCVFQLFILEEIIDGNKSPEFSKQSVENPNVMYLPFKCSLCGNLEARRKTKISELIVSSLTGKNPRCKRCRHITPLPKDKKEVPFERIATLAVP